MSPKSEGEKKLLIFCIQKAYLHILILFRQTEIIIILEIKISIKNWYYSWNNILFLPYLVNYIF